MLHQLFIVSLAYIHKLKTNKYIIVVNVFKINVIIVYYQVNHVVARLFFPHNQIFGKSTAFCNEICFMPLLCM
jgi:hypothetical protein